MIRLFGKLGSIPLEAPKPPSIFRLTVFSCSHEASPKTIDLFGSRDSISAMPAPELITLPNHLRGDIWDGMIIDVSDPSGDAVDLSTTDRIDIQIRDGSSRADTLMTSLSTEVTPGGLTVNGSGQLVIEAFVIDYAKGTYYFDIQAQFQPLGAEPRTLAVMKMTVTDDITDL